MRKKSNEERVIDRIPDSLHFPPIHVERVGEAGKGVKADSHRKYNLQDHRRLRDAKQPGKRTREEIVILEEPKYPQINHKANNKQKFPTPADCCFRSEEHTSEL